MTDEATPCPDPSPRLTAAFGAVAERMRGLPIVNPALEVEAVAFAPWNGHWLGVMLTPWFMNLVLMPGEAQKWQPLPRGEKRKYRFPAGTYEFIGAADAALGDYQVCSLMSPVLEFADHATARLVAELAHAALFDPANAEADEVPAKEAGAGAGETPGAGAAKPVAPLSRRGFLSGRRAGTDDGHRG